MKVKNSTFWIGTIVYLCLAILAGWFYMERTAFIDISFHLFSILKDGDVAIQNNRFGSFFTQVFPLIGSKLGLSLKSLAILYSLAFVICYYSIFVVCTQVLKSEKFGIAMLLLSTLMVTDTFYWIQSELPQGLAFLILYFAFLLHTEKVEQKYNWCWYPLLGVMCYALVFFHPLMLFPFLFCSVYFYIHNDSNKGLLKASLLFFILLLAIKSLVFKTNYDSNAMGRIDNLIRYFPNYFSLESNQLFLLALCKKYYLLLMALVGLIFYYWKNQKRLKLYLLVSFFIGYVMLINISYPDGALAFYIENLHLPLAVMVGVPVAFEFFPLKNTRWYAIFAVVLLLRVSHMGFHHTFYTDRVSYLRNYMLENTSSSESKMMIDKKYFPLDTLLLTWASPYEFWLLSTIELGETRSIVITPNVKKLNWIREERKEFITVWGSFKYEEMPEEYFIFNDTSKYRYYY